MSRREEERETSSSILLKRSPPGAEILLRRSRPPAAVFTTDDEDRDLRNTDAMSGARTDRSERTASSQRVMMPSVRDRSAESEDPSSGTSRRERLASREPRKMMPSVRDRGSDEQAEDAEEGASSIKAGDAVLIGGLNGAKHLNGQQGVAKALNSGNGRWVVVCEGNEYQIKTENLTVVGGNRGGRKKRGELKTLAASKKLAQKKASNHIDGRGETATEQVVAVTLANDPRKPKRQCFVTITQDDKWDAVKTRVSGKLDVPERYFDMATGALGRYEKVYGKRDPVLKSGQDLQELLDNGVVALLNASGEDKYAPPKLTANEREIFMILGNGSKHLDRAAFNRFGKMSGESQGRDLPESAWQDICSKTGASPDVGLSEEQFAKMFEDVPPEKKAELYKKIKEADAKAKAPKSKPKPKPKPASARAPGRMSWSPPAPTPVSSGYRFEKQAKRLQDMGFERNPVVTALNKHNGNEGAALNDLMSGPSFSSNPTAKTSQPKAFKWGKEAKRLADMGFAQSDCEKALTKHNGNEANALNELLASM